MYQQLRPLFVYMVGESRSYAGEWFSQISYLDIRKKMVKSCVWERSKSLEVTCKGLIKMKTHQARPVRWELARHGLWMVEIKLIRKDMACTVLPSRKELGVREKKSEIWLLWGFRVQCTSCNMGPRVNGQGWQIWKRSSSFMGNQWRILRKGDKENYFCLKKNESWLFGGIE